MSIEPGATLGPYTILSPLGAGGMGVVYRARDSRLGRDVAVKVLLAAMTQDKDLQLRFEQEARAAGALNHPNLLTIYDVGTSDGAPYIVCELLEGETLRDRLVDGPLPLRRTIDYAIQMTHGLAAAHEKGIVHRDLKPENIFITKDNRAKILDFGLAKLNPNFSGEGPTMQMAATEPGMVLGTVGYMSPEQVRGLQVDHRSDIFSLGTIFYEMLAGSRAFIRDSAVETMTAILKEEPVNLLDTVPNVPPALERIINHCLEKNRDSRFQSARDLGFNLETFAAQHALAGGASNPQAAYASGPATAQRQSAAQQISKPAQRTIEQNLPTTVQSSGGQGAVSPSTLRPRTSPPATDPVRPQQPRATPARTMAPQRPTPQPRTLTRTLLLILLAVSLVATGVAAGFYLSSLRPAKGSAASFARVSFRSGEVRSARLSADGETIIYSAAWEGKPHELFVTQRQNRESRPIGIADADVLAISRTGEMAIQLRRDPITGLGTLARVPMVGGTPREVQENVISADWSPDGSKLAVIRALNGKQRLEFPAGKVLYETPHSIHDVRISPDGTRLAFLERQGGAYDISLIEGNEGPRTLARGWNRGARGLAWAPDGKQIWMTGTDTAAPPALYAVTLKGDVRLVSRVTGSLRLQDIAGNGLVLLSHSVWRAALRSLAPGETAERDLSWLDWSIANDLSPDGRTLLFTESREGGGQNGSIYLRNTDGGPPVRLGDGYADGLSHDGKWVLAHSGGKLVLLPTGTGEPVELKTAGSFDQGAAWFPDGKRILLAGAVPPEAYGLNVIDIESGKATAISREPISGDAYRPFCISPDGTRVAALNGEKMLVLFEVSGGRATAVPLAEAGEIPIQWSADGGAIFVYRPSIPARITRIDLVLNSRQPWRELVPADLSGVYKIAPVFMTPDGTSYVYNSLRTVSDLYVAEGLE